MSPVSLVGPARAYLRHVPGVVGKRALARHLDDRLARHPRRRVVATAVGPTAVDTADLIDRYLYLFGCWEPHLTRWLPTRVGPGDVVVDVGAHTGWFTRVALRAGADVVAVEPSPDAVAVLRRHVAPAGSRARVLHAAVAARAGDRAFGLPDPANRGAASTLTAPGPAAFVAPARPLEALLTDDELARARVVKVDVEGDEADVVDALVPLLPRMRDDVEIAVEVAPDRLAARGRDPRAVVEPLVAAGFGIFRVPNDYRAESYPAQMRRGPFRPAPRPPAPFGVAVTEQHDLVFSRGDPAAPRRP